MASQDRSPRAAANARRGSLQVLKWVCQTYVIIKKGWFCKAVTIDVTALRYNVIKYGNNRRQYDLKGEILPRDGMFERELNR